LPLQEREAVATEMAVKDDHQRDVSSSLVCIEWGLLHINSHDEVIGIHDVWDSSYNIHVSAIEVRRKSCALTLILSY